MHSPVPPSSLPPACSPPAHPACPLLSPLSPAVRNPALFFLHSLVALAMGIIIGLVFLDLDMTNIGGRGVELVAGLQECLPVK